jgi:two-component system sensor histidine kinase KdpD
MSLHRNWRSVEDLIDAALAQAEPLTQQHKIAVIVPDELPVVRVDGRTVTEVIYTLLDNACKYAPLHSQITISARANSPDSIEIAVEDRGPGIPPAYREKVFERFYRIADNGIARGSTNGIGMGLAIAKGIVAAHGGRIWIENATSGCGTRVAFTVPVGDEDVAAEEQVRLRDVKAPPSR